jgi:hypothetical protein
MRIENTKLKNNQTIFTWKWLHQHPYKNLAAHRGAGMASCHVLLLFNFVKPPRGFFYLKLSTNTSTSTSSLEA